MSLVCIYVVCIYVLYVYTNMCTRYSRGDRIPAQMAIKCSTSFWWQQKQHCGNPCIRHCTMGHINSCRSPGSRDMRATEKQQEGCLTSATTRPCSFIPTSRITAPSWIAVTTGVPGRKAGGVTSGVCTSASANSSARLPASRAQTCATLPGSLRHCMRIELKWHEWHTPEASAASAIVT